MSQEVQRYIAKQKSPQREICQKAREIILKTFPGIREEIRMGVPWYEGKFYIVALKDHVNLGFTVNGLTKKESELFEGAGKFMRHIKIHALKEMDEDKIVKLLKLVHEKARCEECK